MLTYRGLNIVSHPLVRDVKDVYSVESTKIKKRRRSWFVLKTHIDKPGCWQVGNTLYMHPELYDKLKKELAG